jgi:hypothetical protein
MRVSSSKLGQERGKRYAPMLSLAENLADPGLRFFDQGNPENGTP